MRYREVSQCIKKEVCVYMKRRYTAAAAMMMEKDKKLAMAICMALLLGVSASAFAEKNIDEYKLDTITVYGDRLQKDKFQNVVTEQSYYRTGGDVDVVTSEEIEKKHYTSITNAVRMIPGVRVSETGYRNNNYGGGYAYTDQIMINGDPRVIVLVDGKRVDNTVSSMGSGTSSANAANNVMLDKVIDINAIEKIEVIKGPSASVYGADAVGGAINIITKKGSVKNRGTIDVSTGSWKKHNYNLSYSGSAGKDNSFKYLINASRQMSGNTHYKDGQTGNNYEYANTDYKEDSTYIKLENDFDKNHNLRFTHSFNKGISGYPYMAPDYTVPFKEAFKYPGHIPPQMTDMFDPGYRNTFYSYVVTGGNYHESNTNDYDITYTFNKDNGMESFVRAYYNTRRYGGYESYYTNTWPDETIYPGGIFDPNWIAEHYRSKHSPTSWKQEKNKGVQVQFAKRVGVNDIITSWTLDQSRFNNIRLTGSNAGTTVSKRDSLTGYIQDKIHISDKWELTPALRYSHYKGISQKTPTGAVTEYNNSNVSNITPVLSTQYAFDDTFSTYASWTKVFRPVKQSDTTATPINGPLQDEKGFIVNWGIKKDISEKTNVNLNLNYTNMTNKIASLSLYDPDTGEEKNYTINATQKKKALNLGINHQFDEHLTAAVNYSYVNDKTRGKNLGKYQQNIDKIFSTTGTNKVTSSSIDQMMNKIVPPNQYSVELNYNNRHFNANLSELIYSGCSTETFTDKRFLVTNLNLNYDIKKDTTIYLAINNLFNEAYQTKYYAHTGKGAYPGLGRNFMIGLRYKF